MTEAPEKMWAMADVNGRWSDGHCSNAQPQVNTLTAPFVFEYTRSDIADTLRAEVARLKAAIEPFADVSDFLASETEGLSDDDVFNLKLAGARFLVMTYTAKQFHNARAALAHEEAE